MEAAAHNPAFAQKAGIPQKVAKEFVAADKAKAKTKKKGKHPSCEGWTTVMDNNILTAIGVLGVTLIVAMVQLYFARKTGAPPRLEGRDTRK
jgi:hypothetical protein